MTEFPYVDRKAPQRRLQPRRAWLYRVLFQIHLWSGLAGGLYVIIICVTGSIVVLRLELYDLFRPGTVVRDRVGEQLTDEQVSEAVRRVYPDFTVTGMVQPRRNGGIEVALERDGEKREAAFDPYTGDHLGEVNPRGLVVLHWLIDLHGTLLLGRHGRAVNAIGALLVGAMCLSGIVIWWPGVQLWRRRTIVRWNVSWKRLHWDLHCAVGFWTVALTLIWTLSGLYLSVPSPFHDLVDWMEPSDGSVQVRWGDFGLEWLAKLHFGRFAGLPLKLLWFALGLTPPLLVITGGIMWWNRVLSHKWRSLKSAPTIVHEHLRLAPDLVGRTADDETAA